MLYISRGFLDIQSTLFGIIPATMIVFASRIVWYSRFKRSNQSSIATFAIVTPLFFILFFGLFTHLQANIIYGNAVNNIAKGLNNNNSKDKEIENIIMDIELNKFAVTNQLWARQMIPPPLRPSCLLAQPRICQLAEQADNMYVSIRWYNREELQNQAELSAERRKALVPEYLALVGMSLLATLTSIGLAAYYNRLL
jgi:hypothetical protein